MCCTYISTCEINDKMRVVSLTLSRDSAHSTYSIDDLVLSHSFVLENPRKQGKAEVSLFKSPKDTSALDTLYLFFALQKSPLLRLRFALRANQKANISSLRDLPLGKSWQSKSRESKKQRKSMIKKRINE